MIFRFGIFLTLVILLTTTAFAGLKQQISSLEKKYNSRIGISAVHAESGEQFHYRADEWFKLASTNKVPIAITLLKMAEEGELDLDEMLDIELSDIVPGSGLMGYFFSRPGLSISAYNLLEPMMAISDNSATDRLLRRMGGITKVQSMLRQYDVEGIFVDNSILDMFLTVEAIDPRPAPGTFDIHDWVNMQAKVSKQKKSASYQEFDKNRQDSTTPRGMTNLLRDAFDGKILTAANSHLLFEIMTHSLTSRARIAKKLPKTVQVANKTGTWWSTDPITKIKYLYTNDVGMIVTPSGDHILLSVYVDSSKPKVTTKKQVEAISEAALVIYNKFTK